MRRERSSFSYQRPPKQGIKIGTLSQKKVGDKMQKGNLRKWREESIHPIMQIDSSTIDTERKKSVNFALG